MIISPCSLSNFQRFFFRFIAELGFEKNLYYLTIYIDHCNKKNMEKQMMERKYGNERVH